MTDPMTGGPHARQERDRIDLLEKQVEALQQTLGTLVIWMAGSAASPISQAEAAKLLESLRVGR